MSAADSQPTDGQLESLESKADLNENRAKRCGWAVIAGLVIETALTGIFPAHASGASNFWLALIETWGPVFADALVALGVYGEIRFSGKARRIDGELRRLSNKRVEAAEKTLAEATDRLAKVEFDNGYLEETIAMAVERAANAELETQRLKAQFAWRDITPEQEMLLRHELSKFPGASLIIRFFMYDIESQNLAEIIGAIFKLASWKVRFSPEAYTGIFEFGFLISPAIFFPFDRGHEENIRVSDAVKTAFSNANMDFLPLPPPSATMTMGGRGDDLAPPCAQLYVGPKPRPLIE
jgi:hypothetical protein